MFPRPVPWRHASPASLLSLQAKRLPRATARDVIHDFAHDLANDLRSQPGADRVAAEADRAQGFDAGDALTFRPVANTGLPEAGIRKGGTVAVVRRDQAPVQPGREDRRPTNPAVESQSPEAPQSGSPNGDWVEPKDQKMEALNGSKGLSGAVVAIREYTSFRVWDSRQVVDAVTRNAYCNAATGYIPLPVLEGQSVLVE